MRALRLVLLACTLLFVGAGCLGRSRVEFTPVSLEYWRIEDAPEALEPLIADYKKIHPNISITIRTFRTEEYEQKLLEAFAEDRGPDIFSVPNTRLRTWLSKLAPIPETITLPTLTVDDNQKVVAVMQEAPVPTVRTLLDEYVDTVRTDILYSIPTGEKGQTRVAIFGLRLSMDTLGLYYNKDLLTAAQITKPPVSWAEMQDLVGKLTIKAADGSLVQSGIALGTAQNVDHATDIVMTLMMQNGAIVTDSSGRAAFHQYTPTTRDNTFPPGVEALLFYESFAEPTARNYSWNASQPNALDAFISGKTAFYVGFPHERALITSRAPRLHFAVAALPQISSSSIANVAHYPLEVVAKKSAHPNEAWDFLIYLSQPEQAARFLATTKRPTVLRSLITKQLEDPEINMFTRQVLTARSWYRGTNYSAAEDAVRRMIMQRPVGRQTYMDIASAAAYAIDATQ